MVVTNLGEAAYEAELGIAFPPSLSYVGLGPGSDINAPSLVNRCQSGDFLVSKICKSLSHSSFLSIDLGNPFKGISKEAEEELKKDKEVTTGKKEEKAANTAKLLLRFSPSNLINQTVIRFTILNIILICVN